MKTFNDERWLVPREVSNPAWKIARVTVGASPRANAGRRAHGDTSSFKPHQYTLAALGDRWRHGDQRWQATSAISRICLVCTVLLFGGCRICADCEDRAYPAYGGAWQRTIRDSGRVGSIFDPAGARTFDLAARDDPEDAIQQERLRYQQQNAGGDSDELDYEAEDTDEGDAESRLKDRSDELKQKELDEIENPKEQEQKEKKLEEIDVNVIDGQPLPPIL